MLQKIKNIFWLFVYTSLILSCSEKINKNDISDIPVTIILTDANHTVNNDDLFAIRKLFMNNHLSMKNLQIIGYYKFSQMDQLNVLCKQSYKDLPIFFDNIFYSFQNNGQLKVKFGEQITNLDISLTPVIRPVDAVKTVRNNLDDYLAITSADSYYIELGLYNRTQIFNESKSSYSLVWNIRTNSDSPYPFAMVNTIDGKIIAYVSDIKEPDIISK